MQVTEILIGYVKALMEKAACLSQDQARTFRFFPNMGDPKLLSKIGHVKWRNQWLGVLVARVLDLLKFGICES